MIKNIEGLHSELPGQPFSQFGLFHERKVNLPGVERPNEAIRRAAESAHQPAGQAAYWVATVVKPSDYPTWIERRRGERRGINLQIVHRRSSAQQDRHSGNQDRPLCRLIFAIGQLGGVDVHCDRQWMPSMPEANTAEAPATHDLAHSTAAVQE